jgi:hypothetical protein
VVFLGLILDDCDFKASRQTFPPHLAVSRQTCSDISLTLAVRVGGSYLYTGRTVTRCPRGKRKSHFFLWDMDLCEDGMIATPIAKPYC